MQKVRLASNKLLTPKPSKIKGQLFGSSRGKGIFKADLTILRYFHAFLL